MLKLLYINKRAIFLLGSFLLIGLALWYISTPTLKEVSTQKTFSTTQSWDPELLELATTTPLHLPDFQNKVSLLPPPSNDSSITSQEIDHLNDLASRRSIEDVARINQELSLPDAHFGQQPYGELFNPTIRSHSVALIDELLKDFGPIIMYYKKEFDRIRPSYLDPTLTTVIEVPGHPAYPSGHAAQSMLIALVLSELDPDNAQAYEDSARSIAHNREVAGVHYPSDSVAGQLLARDYYQEMTKTEWYQSQIAKAKTEW